MTALGVNRFNLDFERDFKTPDDVSGAVTLLPKLFDCSGTYQLRNVCSRLLDHEGRPFDAHAQGPAPGRQMASQATLHYATPP